MSAFVVPAAEGRHAIEIKRSRFIASVARAADRAAAEQFIARIRSEFADATHNTFAFIAGVPGSTGDIGCSDDGEVSGTAGRPMLNILQHSAFAETVIVVTRYYGGTLLGSGGLVRAYSQAAKDALEHTPRQPLQRWVRLQIQAPFADESMLRHCLDSNAAVIDDIRYGHDVILNLRVAEQAVSTLLEQLDTRGRGRVKYKRVD